MTNPNMDVMLSSKKQDWGTPPELLKQWEQDHSFYTVLDPCASPDNPLKADIFYTKWEDGLERGWYIINHEHRTMKTIGKEDIIIDPAVFVNPGYGVEYRLMIPDDQWGDLSSLDKFILYGLDLNWTSKQISNVRLIEQKQVSQRIKHLCGMGYARKQGCGDWVRKAVIEHSRHGSTIVMLLPYKAPAWYHDYVKPYLDAVDDPMRHYFPLRGRIKFTGATQGAPFDSCLFILREEW